MDETMSNIFKARLIKSTFTALHALSVAVIVKGYVMLSSVALAIQIYFLAFLNFSDISELWQAICRVWLLVGHGREYVPSIGFSF